MDRSNANMVDAFNRLAGPRNDIKMMHADQAEELVSACKELRWIHDWSTPGMPKKNCIVDNKVKPVLHGARVILRSFQWQAAFPSGAWLVSSPAPNRVKSKRGGGVKNAPGAHDNGDYGVKDEESECVNSFNMN